VIARESGLSQTRARNLTSLARNLHGIDGGSEVHPSVNRYNKCACLLDLPSVTYFAFQAIPKMNPMKLLHIGSSILGRNLAADRCRRRQPVGMIN
jgi:hypothetical protein